MSKIRREECNSETCNRTVLTISTVFSHASTVVQCGNCATVLCQPSGGKAKLTEGEFSVHLHETFTCCPFGDAHRPSTLLLHQLRTIANIQAAPSAERTRCSKHKGDAVWFRFFFLS